MIYEKTTHHPIRSSLELAEERLRFVLEHPNGVDKERILLALSLITYVRLQQETGAKQKAQSARVP